MACAWPALGRCRFEKRIQAPEKPSIKEANYQRSQTTGIQDHSIQQLFLCIKYEMQQFDVAHLLGIIRGHCDSGIS